MRTSHSASLLVAAAILWLVGCSQEAPKLNPPHREKPAPQAATPPQVHAGNELVAAPSREKVGAGHCRACHRLQYDSWVKSGHARKALDCEGCHGNGSEYARAEVMKDPARAKAAGLIFQTAAFCEKCHPTADAAFLPKAHAHKHRRAEAPSPGTAPSAP
jgi:hypothetical protein